LIVLAIAGVVAFTYFNQGSRGAKTVAIRVPELSTQAKRGARAFESNCARCHGANAGGSDNGPPLVHRIYEPSHHDDIAIRRAVRLGVKPHHWRFGSMPRIDVSNRELDGIITYIRELQQANGIR
jgi:mono/diheme cytochrome c family protein